MAASISTGMDAVSTNEVVKQHQASVNAGLLVFNQLGVSHVHKSDNRLLFCDCSQGMRTHSHAFTVKDYMLTVH